MRVFDDAKREATDEYSVDRDLLSDIDSLSQNLKKQYRFYRLLCNWIESLIDGYKVESFFYENDYRRIVIYGFKELGKLLYRCLVDSEVVVTVVDRNRDELWEDVSITSPDEMGKIECDVIVVTAVNDFDSIADGLKNKVNCDIISLESVIEYARKGSVGEDTSL